MKLGAKEQSAIRTALLRDVSDGGTRQKILDVAAALARQEDSTEEADQTYWATVWTFSRPQYLDELEETYTMLEDEGFLMEAMLGNHDEQGSDKER